MSRYHVHYIQRCSVLSSYSLSFKLECRTSVMFEALPNAKWVTLLLKLWADLYRTEHNVEDLGKQIGSFLQTLFCFVLFFESTRKKRTPIHYLPSKKGKTSLLYMLPGLGLLFKQRHLGKSSNHQVKKPFLNWIAVNGISWVQVVRWMSVEGLRK